ncbi:MAG: ShlB/FhaC/HecB family hemolysin secretion/activation protein [Polaromonas sp.]|nr:ShlB/FhaC/HecB family hemolysin secretion/activation protein [Polaromonas sp.]
MKSIATFLILSFPFIANAAPDAGELLRQAQPIVVPPKSPMAAGLVINAAVMPVLQETKPFLVKKIKLVGNKKVSSEILYPLIAEAEGKTLTLAQLEKIIARITDYYVANGVPLARAIVPAQTIADGNVIVQIIVAQYGAIKVVNRSHSSDLLLAETLSTLKAGDDIEQPALNRALLLTSDLPGARATSTLSPGKDVGTSDLTLVIESAPRVSGRIAADNFGIDSFGKVRASGTVTILDPFGSQNSDQVTVSGLSSGPNMTYGRVGYDAVVTGSGTRVGAAASALKYTLGSGTTGIDSAGTASVVSALIKQPILRTVDANVSVQIQMDSLKLSDKIGSIHNDRNIRDVSLTVLADSADTELGGGRNSALVSLTAGQVNITNADYQKFDALSAQTAGSFSKVNGAISRLQSLGPTSEVLVAVAAQVANKNLDSSQKMTLGGANSIRGFKPGTVSGDSGYTFTTEYRQALGSVAKGNVTGLAFFDTGTISLNKNALSATNKFTLRSVGLGLNWAGPYGWNTKAYVATPVGEIAAVLNAKNSARAWVEVSNNF